LAYVIIRATRLLGHVFLPETKFIMLVVIQYNGAQGIDPKTLQDCGINGYLYLMHDT
jgi:hypothetical protein